MAKKLNVRVEEEKAFLYLISPENELKASWDFIITCVLLFSVALTPLQMALFEEPLRPTWQWINNCIDILFLIDIIIIFNTATYDDDFHIITDRATITSDYLKTWFLLDFFCIIPFDYMFGGGGSTNIIRLVRIGRINKILKLMKLMRLTRIKRKNSESCLSSLQDYMKFSSAEKWFISFFGYFCLTAHVICCLWLITAKLDPASDSWLNSLADASNSEIYLTSFYFTITTITTVGYGDWSASTFVEMIAATVIMFIGVIAFSFASGTLTNYIQ